MNDPHVEALTYAFVAEKGVTFKNPPELKFTTPDFVGRLSNNVLTLEPQTHFADAEVVRPIADALVTAWVIREGAATGRNLFQFRHMGDRVVDRAPGPGSGGLRGHAGGYATVSGNVEIQRAGYPTPPGDFQVTAVIEVIWWRYATYLAGGETLLAMAFYCLDFLETKAGGRQHVPKRFGVDGPVLRTLGRLTSEHGDPRVARKGTASKPLTEAEADWIKAAIRKIILHLGGPKPAKRLAISDLPTL